MPEKYVMSELSVLEVYPLPLIFLSIFLRLRVM